MTPNPSTLLDSRVASLTENYLSAEPVSGKSLISTLFGDSVVPHGGCIWLENIIRLVAPIGINERLVRTSVYRLMDDDWIVNTRSGRRSYYQLSDKGRQQTAVADKLIYHGQPATWDGQWTLVFATLPDTDTRALTELREQLGWFGFGKFSRNVYGHPNIELSIVESIVRDLKLQDKVVCMQATSPDPNNWTLATTDAELARHCFPYQEVEMMYQGFIDRYSDLASKLMNTRDLDDESSFVLRTLLIHSYRRIVLKDPQLPAELLPDPWAGYQAREICARIYRSISDAANQHYQRVCGGDSEIVVSLNHNYGNRFSETQILV